MILSNSIRLNELLSKDIKKILEGEKEPLKLIEKFNKNLLKFISEELEDKDYDNIIDDYIDESQKYKYEGAIRDEIIKVVYNLIDNNKDEEPNYKGITKIINIGNYINKYTFDIVSRIIEYIKDYIFNA